MARIYKESRYVLQLLIGKSYGAQYDDVKISFYTKNPSNQVMVDNDITIKRNIAEVKIESTLFDNLEDGLIKYIVYGTKDGIPFIEERISNYFLKTPLDFKPGESGTTCNLEDKSVTPSMGDRNVDGYIIIEKSEGYDGLSRVVINPQTIYNEGVEADRADIAANARVLNVTENGVYRSKFSDLILPTVTGVYADGTDFYNYAELNGKVFNTKIAGSVDRRLEFWYKGDNTLASDFWNVIIGSGDIDNSDCFQVKYFIDLNNQLSIEVGNSNILIDNWDDTVWHHLIISKAEGLWIDGEKKGDFSPSNTINGEFFINGIGYNADGSRSANGTFGMIKIDNTIIIPTADGFQNVNTGELLEVVHNGDYTFTENLPISPEGELYKTINVNVASQCNLGETEFEFSISDFADIFELYSSDEGYDGWSKVTIRFNNSDWVNIYNAGKIFKDYNNGTSPGVGNYGYVCGKITEIQEVNTSAENNYASFTLDNCFKISKAKWYYNNKVQFESEDQIKIGDYAVVFGVFQDNNGSLQFEEGTSTIIADEECKNVSEYPYSHIPTNTIYYKTADGQLSEKIGLDLNGRPSGFGLGINGEVLNIVSNTYEDGVGKIVFDGEVYKVGPVMYSNATETGNEVIKLENIVEIQLPSSITRVENGAFSQTGLREIILPPNITQIDTYALKDMQYLYRIVFYSDEPEILQNNEITLSQTTFGKILHNKAYDYSNMKSNTYYKQKGWTFETF